MHFRENGGKVDFYDVKIDFYRVLSKMHKYVSETAGIMAKLCENPHETPTGTIWRPKINF